MRFVLIVSRASVQRKAEGEVEIMVNPSANAKCERCWHYRADVGGNAEHLTICGRCVSNLFGNGEPRSHA